MGKVLDQGPGAAVEEDSKSLRLNLGCGKQVKLASAPERFMVGVRVTVVWLCSGCGHSCSTVVKPEVEIVECPQCGKKKNRNE